MPKKKKVCDVKDLPNEQWKDVVGYEGLYEVSNKGRVKTFVRQHKILKTPLNQHGYPYTGLTKDGKHNTYLVHRLVAIAFLPNNDHDKIFVNHIDGNKANSNVENLEWCTVKENNNHAVQNGLKTYENAKGEGNTSAKLSGQQVLEIRLLHSSKSMSRSAISTKFDIAKSTVTRIVSRRLWKHI